MGILHFLKFCIMPFCFYERPTSVTVFANWKKYEEDFSFYEKRWNVIIVINICFAASCYRGSQSGPSNLLPWEPQWASQPPATRVQSSAQRHTYFISIYFVHLLARCVLRYQKILKKFISLVWECSKFFSYKLMIIASLLYTISAYET